MHSLSYSIPQYQTQPLMRCRQQLRASERFSRSLKLWSAESRRFNWSLCDRTTQRHLRKIAFLGTAALDGEDGLMVEKAKRPTFLMTLIKLILRIDIQFTRVLNRMQTIYSTAKVCIGGECGLELDPGMATISPQLRPLLFNDFWLRFVAKNDWFR